MREIHIVFATDRFYLKPTCIAIESVLQVRTNQEDYYHFYILMPVDEVDAEPDYFEKIQCQYHACTIERIGIEDIFKKASLPIAHITEPTYYRLLLPELLQQEKCIYLDSDIVVCKDISELYDINIDGCVLGGVISPSYVVMEDYAEKIGIPSTSKYINAGVLLLNLEQMRKDNFTQEALKLIDRSFPSSDQDIINLMAYNRIKLLPYKYNMSPALSEPLDCFAKDEVEEALTQPVILHYKYPEKPWECLDINQADKWWNVCVKSFLLNAFLEEQRYSLFYYSVIKNLSLWKCDIGSSEWFDEIKKYKKCYVYGAGKVGDRVLAALLLNGVQIEKVLVSSLGENKKTVQGIPVEEFAENIEKDALIFLAVSKQFQLQIRRKLFQCGIFHVIPVTEV